MSFSNYVAAIADAIHQQNGVPNSARAVMQVTRSTADHRCCAGVRLAGLLDFSGPQVQQALSQVDLLQPPVGLRFDMSTLILLVRQLSYMSIHQCTCRGNGASLTCKDLRGFRVSSTCVNWQKHTACLLALTHFKLCSTR